VAGGRGCSPERGKMQAKEGVVDYLNRILTVELTVINQYVLQSEMYRGWGFERLYEKMHELSLDEMRDAQTLISHILYLEGVPNVQRMGTVRIGQTVQENLEIDLGNEREAVELLREAIQHCQAVGDFTTRGKLEASIQDEETHVDWFETQLEAIRRVGIENYLTEQLK
jgi:bacterioferritin